MESGPNNIHALLPSHPAGLFRLPPDTAKVFLFTSSQQWIDYLKEKGFKLSSVTMLSYIFSKDDFEILVDRRYMRQNKIPPVHFHYKGEHLATWKGTYLRVTYSANDLFTFIDALVDQSLLPLCIHFEWAQPLIERLFKEQSCG